MANANHHNMQGKASEMKTLVGTFTTNTTSDPDGVTGDIDSVAYDDVGDFTVTLKHGYPQAIAGFAQVLGEEPNLFARVVSMANIASGTFTVNTFNNSSGTHATVDTDDKVIQVFLIVRNTKLTQW